MTVETASYISQLNPSYPAAGDPKSEGDDHLRLTKTVLQTQFPNLGATAVTATAAELNAATGNIALKANKAGDTYAGTHDFTGATINVPTASATDNDTSAASTAFVQSAILASSGVSAVLPGQGGNSGKFLTTNGTAASWASVPGQSGTTITGNVTLTASSAAGMSVTPTSPGLYATLPDATTCSKATTLFSIYNAGDYDYGVKDSAGTQLGWVRARTGAMIGLADNSTAAGTWTYYGLEKLGITASYVNSTLGNIGTTIRRIALDANRTCFLFGLTDCYAIVYDASTQTWGSATLVRSSIQSNAYLGVLSATNQVLVVSNDSTTGMEAVTLTISGTTITVNSGTKGTATLAGNYSSFGQLIAVSTSWVVSYNRATTAKSLRAITVSGTTPTIGSEVNPTVAYSADGVALLLYASSSMVRAVGMTASTTISVTNYSVSGSTLSLNTQATATTTATSFRAFLNGNGNIVCHYINTTHFATIFKLTGTTEAASSVSLGNVPTSVTTQADYVAISASKTAFISGASSTTWSANILTDTAGTASAGTQITGTAARSIVYVTGITVSGNSARFGIYEASGGDQALAQITLDCSGASPVFSSRIATNGASAGAGTATFLPSDVYGNRTVGQLVAGASFYSIASGNYVFDIRSGQSYITRVTSMTLPLFSVSGVIGAASNESYLAGPSFASSGFVIQRVEAAA